MALVPLVSLTIVAPAVAQTPPEPPEAPVEPLTPAPRLPVEFLSDQEVELSEPAEDVFGFGQRVVTAARVVDNAFLAGQEVRVDAPVEGDLFAAGETVRIAAPVGGDVYVGGSDVVVEGRGSVAGNVFAGAGVLRLEGPVAGDLTAGAGRVVLAAPIGGDVKLDVGELSIKDGAQVAGTLTYESPREAGGVDDLNAAEVRFTLTEEHEGEPHHDEPEQRSFVARAASFTAWTTWSYASKLLVGFTFLVLGGRAAGRVARALIEQPARAMGLGFVVTCVLPVASMLAMALLIPLPLGVLGMMALAVGLYAAQVLSAQAIGDLILRRIRPNAVGSPYVSMAVGLVPLVLLVKVPWLGVVVWLAASIGGIGALWLATRKVATAA